MQIYVSEQWSYLAYSLLFGVLCGLLHDLLCQAPLSLGLSKLLTFLHDLAFMLISTVITVAIAYTTNGGIYRLYAIAASVSAFTLYKLSVGRYVLSIELYFIEKILKVFIYLINMFKIVLDISVKFVKIIMVNYQTRIYKRKILSDILRSFSGKEANGQQRK